MALSGSRGVAGLAGEQGAVMRTLEHRLVAVHGKLRTAFPPSSLGELRVKLALVARAETVCDRFSHPERPNAPVSPPKRNGCARLFCVRGGSRARSAFASRHTLTDALHAEISMVSSQIRQSTWTVSAVKLRDWQNFRTIFGVRTSCSAFTIKAHADSCERVLNAGSVVIRASSAHTSKARLFQAL